LQNAQDVARYLLVTQDPNGERITNLKLQKLVYFAQGFYLGWRGRPLFSESIKAWAHGPVVPALWHEYRQYGSNPLPLPTSPPSGFTSDERAVLDSVTRAYGGYSAWDLREITHREPPWVEAFNRPGGPGAIAHSALEAQYKGRVQAPTEGG